MIRAGFIGAGGISGVHLRYLKTRDDVEIAALCDVARESAEKRSAEYGGEVFTDFVEMLDGVRPDAVWLCTPPQVRAEPLFACARRGIPVLCEKPVERDAGAGRDIAAELDELGAKVQVGYCFRTIPCLEKLREFMADDPIHVVHSFYGCPMSRGANTKSWFFDKDKSGGALIDQATHNLDLLRFLFGEVRTVWAQARNPLRAKEPGYTIDETITLMLAFEDGPLATHGHTWVGDGWRNELLMSGEKHLYRLQPGGQKLTVEDGSGGKSFPKEDDLKLWDYENVKFLEQVASGDWSANPCGYSDGLKTLELTLACDGAIEQGKIDL